MTDHKTMAGGLTQTKVKLLINEWKNKLQEDVAEIIDWERTNNLGRRVLSSKICFWILRDHLTWSNVQKVHEDLRSVVADSRFNDRAVWTMKEINPEDKPRIAAGAKARAHIFSKMHKFVRENADAPRNEYRRENNISIEWNSPLRIYFDDNTGSDPKLMAQWDEKIGFTCMTEIFDQVIPGFHVGEFQKASSVS